MCHTGRQRDRHAHVHVESGRQIERPTDGQTDRKMNVNKAMDIHADSQLDR